MVGNNYDEIYFTNLATEIRNAFNEKFYQEEKKHMVQAVSVRYRSHSI